MTLQVYHILEVSFRDSEILKTTEYHMNTTPINTTFSLGCTECTEKNEAPRLRALRSREQVVNLKELSSKNEVTLGISDILRLREFKNSISNIQ